MRLLSPAPDDLLALREVGDFVNDVRDDGPHLVEPREEAQPQLF
jgi:putative SOS response-associated peptidase YedK